MLICYVCLLKTSFVITNYSGPDLWHWWKCRFGPLNVDFENPCYIQYGQISLHIFSRNACHLFLEVLYLIVGWLSGNVCVLSPGICLSITWVVWRIGCFLDSVSCRISTWVTIKSHTWEKECSAAWLTSVHCKITHNPLQSLILYRSFLVALYRKP